MFSRRDNQIHYVTRKGRKWIAEWDRFMSGGYVSFYVQVKNSTNYRAINWNDVPIKIRKWGVRTFQIRGRRVDFISAVGYSQSYDVVYDFKSNLPRPKQFARGA